MRFSRALLVEFLPLLACLFSPARGTDSDVDAEWDEVEDTLLREANALVNARWKYATHLNEKNAATLVEATIRYRTNFLSLYMQKLTNETDIESSMRDGWNHLVNNTLLVSQMETIYKTAKLCRYDDRSQCDLSLTDVNYLMASSINYDELKYYWMQWHDNVGKSMRDNYLKYLSSNRPTEHRINSYYSPIAMSDGVKKYLFHGYAEEDFRNDIDNLWLKVKPLYIQLYTYVRRVLATKLVYKGVVKLYGRLPSHILGGVESKSWRNLAQLVMPYRYAPSIDSTEELIRKRFKAKEIFKLAESFFVGLGLEPLNKAFWANSILEKQRDRDIDCHASAEDFLFGPGNDTSLREDYRIKMCIQTSHEDLMAAIHELGHVKYFQSYKNQELRYRDAANPGFYEAIGNSLGLTFSTPSHLQNNGLLVESDNRKIKPLFDDLPPLPSGITEQELNYLLSQALEKIPYIPFVLTVEKWRLSVFNGTVGIKNLNSYWWKLVRELQGIKPPVDRTEEAFDPGSVYHIAADAECTRYFVSAILQFQVYEGLCKWSGKFQQNTSEDLLFRCDFSNHKKISDRLRPLMEAGSSQPWPDLLEYIAGSREMDASSLLTYFKPLYEWLVKANEKQCLGWETNCEEIAADYMANEHEERASKLEYNSAVANWNYQTNLTEDNANNMTNWAKKAALFDYETLEYLRQFDYDDFKDESLRRQFHLIVSQDTASLEESDFVQLTAAINLMTEHYSTTKICPFKKQKCAPNEMIGLEVLDVIVGSSTNYDELVYIWNRWRDAASKPLRPIYEEYVELRKKEVGYNDMTSYWLLKYDTENLDEEIRSLLAQINPLYQKIHAYTRMKLRSRYKENVIPKDDAPLPVVVLGDMLGQTWGNLYDLLVPYAETMTNDPTSEMERQNWNVTYMFQVAEDFFISLGLEPMPTSYGPESMIEKPMYRDVNCHPSSWDFGNGRDYRISMCTGIDMGSMLTIVHELGHIQYYQQYKHLPTTFRDGANPGFHEAIGDTIALSFETPAHLNRLGIMRDNRLSKEADLNFLMKIALDKVVFLPSAYVIDRWRWGLFQGEFPPSQWTYQWLKLTEEYQGILPPGVRDESDFDPGANFHIVADEEYIGYFVATILQFQIHKALCLASGKYDPEDPGRPLYRCDIYGNREAGDILKKIMQAGASRPWRETLANATGMDRLDASAILEYFQLLDTYLTEQLQRNNETIGWRSTFTSSNKEDDADKKFYVGIALTVVAALFFLTALVCHFRKKRSWASKRKRKNTQVNCDFQIESELMLS